MKNKTFKAFLTVVLFSVLWSVLIMFLMMDGDKSIYFKVLNINDYITDAIIFGLYLLPMYSVLFLLAIPVHLFYRKKGIVSFWYYIIPAVVLSISICFLINGRMSSVGVMSSADWLSMYILEVVVVISAVSLSKLFWDSFYERPYKSLLAWFFIAYFIALTIVAVQFFKERHSDLKQKELAELKVEGSSIEKYKESISIISGKLEGENKAKFDEAVDVIEFVLKDAAYIELKDKNYEQVIYSKDAIQKHYVSLFNLDRKRQVIDCISDDYVDDYNEIIDKINDGNFQSNILNSIVALEKEARPYIERRQVDVQSYKKVYELLEKEVTDFDVAKNSTPLGGMEGYCKSPAEIRARIIEINDRMKELIK